MAGVTRYRKAAHTRRVNRQKLTGPHRSVVTEHDAVRTELLTRDQLKQLLEYARYIEDVRLAGACMRALDGDSMYHSSIMERCTAAYAGAHMSDEFKRANRVANDPGQPAREARRKP